MIAPARHPKDSLEVAGLFAGIGGIELGLHSAGHRTRMFCEIDASARRVLHSGFPGIRCSIDVRAITALPRVELVTAGFPCQDLSQAGQTAGIEGLRSGLVGEVFRLLARSKRSPRWLLLENVPFMLQLDRGRAMKVLTDNLERLGYAWAYRVVDARAFGLPQRRQRVLLLASKTHDPRGPLLNQDAGEPAPRRSDEVVACGFYWTEGNRGLGWAEDAVPTLKGGSTVGIPSPPAIWMPDGRIVTPDIRDVERLQGFPVDWTAPVATVRDPRRARLRWKLVGNAVSVPLANWIGERLRTDTAYSGARDGAFAWTYPWPQAAWGKDGRTREVAVSRWPVQRPCPHLAEFLHYPPKPLSTRATAGFLRRAEASSLRFRSGFLDAVRAHLERVSVTPSAVGS